jgi:anti-anti-sigma factor
MNLEIESFGNTSILRIKEEKLCLPLLRTFYASSTALIDSGTRELVVNLSEVRSIDSASLGCLMDIAHHMARHQGTVKLVGMQNRVESLATMVGLTRRFDVFADEEAAFSATPFLSGFHRTEEVACA